MKKQLTDIDSVLVNREIFEVKFACDVKKCKGACCTLEGEYGAPLFESELPLMKEAINAVLDYIPAEHKAEIVKNGFYERKDGELVTRSYNNKACVFVYYEKQIAKCSLERAFFDGKNSFRKPISCHLFPIRISDFGGDILRYEIFDECKPALENGNNNTTIAEYCCEALVRKYGQKWYDKLVEAMDK